jgi:AraC family transcriptional regulator
MADSSDSELCAERPTRIYTDRPTTTSLWSGGLVEMTDPANMLIRWASMRLQNPPGDSTLAIRWSTNGRRLFESDRERYAVDDATYLVFNYGRRFSSTIDSVTPVDCCTICFDGAFASDVLRALVSPDDRLLDEPVVTGWQSGPSFVEKVTPHDSLVTPYLRKLQRECDSEIATREWFEEQFRGTLVALLQAHRSVFRDMERVPAARASTREEIYFRLNRARDFMEASLFSPLTIPEIAAAAWFSPHHFLRLFKATFGQTPHQYLTTRRIEHAKRLLLNSEVSVTDICTELGFESLGSFSLLFRRHAGLSPDAYRQAHRRRAFGVPLAATFGGG